MFRLLIAFFFSLLAFSSFGYEKSITLTAGNYPPYQSPNLKHYGVVSRIVSEAFALEGVEVTYKFLPWKRAYKYILEGKLDGVGYATKKSSRLEHFYFSEPVFEKKRAFFHLKSTQFDWNNIEDLQGLKIGALLGYSYSDEFDEADAIGLITTQRVNTHQQNMTKLAHGNRIDIALSTIDQGYYALQQVYPEDIELVTYHPKMLQTAGMHLMLSKKVDKNKELVEVFNRGLKKLKQSGKYDQYFMESQRGDYIKP